jgi:LuxR family maltose regulon positive regulatory protein
MELLQEGMNYNLILVSAPAGFGKTTLLSEWVRQNQPDTRAAWLSLDGGDNDPVRFWSYFITALQTIQPACGEKILPLLHSSQPLPVEPMITELINDLSKVSSEFVVVLDDYHLIETQQIHEGITYFIDHIPPHIHLIIASRADPPLPLANYRGKGNMLVIDVDSLRFSTEETIILFNELKTPQLTRENVTALNERTEGWAVGLKMAAFSMSGKKDISKFIAAFTGSQRYVMDYLVEEVLQKQSEEMRDFLLKTSILERLSGSLCDAVTGKKGSQDILLELERGHLFIVPLDESRQWYRYEHLFADLLRHQCEVAFGKEVITELHKQACQWYEEHGFPEEAIEHALVVQEWENASRLIIEHGESTFKRGGVITLNNWLYQLPEKLLFGDVTLCKLYIFLLIAAEQGVAVNIKQYTTIDDMLDHIEEIDTGSDKHLQGYIAALRCISAHFKGDISNILEHGNKALSLLPRGQGNELDTIYLLLAIVKWNNHQRKEAEELLAKALEEAQSNDNQPIVCCVFYKFGELNRMLGKLHRSADYFKQAIGMGKWLQYAPISQVELGGIFYEWNDLEASAFHCQQAIESLQFNPYKTTPIYGYGQLALVRLIQGDESGFLEALDKLNLEVHNVDTPEIKTTHAKSHLLFSLRQNNLDEVSRWLGIIIQHSHTSRWDLRLISYRILVTQGKNSEALKNLHILY